MRILFAIVLNVVHIVYDIFLRVHSLYTYRRAPLPQPLSATRHRIPTHLALVFVVDPSVSLQDAQDALTTSVTNAIDWCRTLGIKKLTVYEETDMLAKCTESLRERLPAPVPDAESSESETDYPLTPPPSDHSLSRPLSPSDVPIGSLIPMTKILIAEPPRPAARKDAPQGTHQKPVKKRKQLLQQKPIAVSSAAAKSDLLLCLISAEASKPAIAATARALAREERRRLQRDPTALRQQKGYKYELSVKELEQILEDESGLSPPDFMIVHPIDSSYSPPAPPELHGFPPWHIRLTEIYQNYPRETPSQAPSLFSLAQSRLAPVPLEELHFRAALDEFASAEMRFGK